MLVNAIVFEKCCIGIIISLIAVVFIIFFRKVRHERKESQKARIKQQLDESYIDWGIDLS